MKRIFWISFLRNQNSILQIMLIGFLLIVLSLPLHSSDIHEAVRKGDLAIVKALVDKTPECINSKDQNGRTPLHWACRGKNHEIVAFLVEKGADVNAIDKNQVAPLHSAAVRNLTKAAELLLSRGAEVNLLDYEKHAPLHYAAMYNATDVASLLIKKGAKLELKDDYGRTPLLLCARERGRPEMTRLLIEAGANVNVRDESGETPLDLAAWRGKAGVVDVLLENGAIIPTKGIKARSLPIFAAEKGLNNLFAKIIDLKVNVTFQTRAGGTLLHLAASGGSEKIVHALIEKGLDVNQKDGSGWAPLHYASMNGQTAAVAKLLEKGADINIRNTMGQTAYNIVEKNKEDKVKELLTVKGADQSPIQFPVLEGDYLGQKPPGEKPEIFARGIVSSIWGLHSTVAFSPAGDEVYWSPMVIVPGELYSRGMIFMTKKVSNHWTPPDVATFFGKDDNGEPFFAPDGSKLYFNSGRPLPVEGNPRKEAIWYVERTKDGWSEPRPLPWIINSHQMHWQFSVDSKGDVYFSGGGAGGFGMGDIWVSRFIEGKYTMPENLGPTINTEKSEGTPFISPDGSYLIFQHSDDLHVCFRNEDGTWTDPQNMGPGINSSSYELCPIVTRDGKYLFFLSTRGGESHAYWVKADIIQVLKKEILNQ